LVKHQINLERRLDVFKTLMPYHQVSGRKDFKNHSDQTTEQAIKPFTNLPTNSQCLNYFLLSEAVQSLGFKTS